MALEVFIYFPETDDEVLTSNEDCIKTLRRMLKLIPDGVKAYYDEQNLTNYLKQIVKLETYLQKEDNQLRLILRSISAISISQNAKRDNNCCYVIWNLNLFVANYAQNIIAEIAERSFLYPQQLYLLFNMQNVINTCRGKILVFKDAKHIDTLPNTFAHIDFICDDKELEIWLATKHKNLFSLLDRKRFRKTSMIQQGKPVFEEISTSFFWYLDNFHKNEYEVFDSNKLHIGVANLDGIIDTSKKVDGRNFN